MKKIDFILILFFTGMGYNVFGQLGGDGSYFWNSTSISYTANHKTEITLSNKDQYSNQIDHLEYFHFDLAAYYRVFENFALGLGIRQNESYKTDGWSPGNAYFFYGVYYFARKNFKVRFSNRIAMRTYKISDTQYTFDNNTTFDFFTDIKAKLPKPYLQDEIFTNLNVQKVQTVRIYGGLHVLKRSHWAIDIYYCLQETRPSWVWKSYDTYGLSTKFHI